MENIQENPYKINLDAFEGPMDLLLYLIKKNDLDIYDIPISFIAEEYLRYLNTLKVLDIDVAGEFLLLASELAHIKSKMLLPTDGSADEDEVDPRADLVRRLIEYQRYKEAAEKLASRNLLYKDVFVPLAPERVDKKSADETIYVEGNTFHLLEAFNKMLEKLPKESVREVTQDRISVSQRIFQLIDKIKFGRTIQLEDILPREELTKHLLVITFLALLEMVRLRMIKIYQAGNFETVHVTGTMQENVHSIEHLPAEVE